MTEDIGRNRKLQRLARSRMRQTGEKYTAALRAVKAEQTEPEADRPRMVETRKDYDALTDDYGTYGSAS